MLSASFHELRSSESMVERVWRWRKRGEGVLDVSVRPAAFQTLLS